MALWDRFIRVIIGVILLTWAIAGGPYWAYCGFYFLATGAWSFCPLYWLLKIKTSSAKKEID